MPNTTAADHVTAARLLERIAIGGDPAWANYSAQAIIRNPNYGHQVHVLALRASETEEQRAQVDHAAEILELRCRIRISKTRSVFGLWSATCHNHGTIAFAHITRTGALEQGTRHLAGEPNVVPPKFWDAIEASAEAIAEATR